LSLTRIQPEPYFSDAPWKFGYAFPITLIAVLITNKMKRFYLKVIIVAIISVMNLANDFRSMTLILLMAFIIYILSTRPRQSSAPSRTLLYALFAAGLIGVMLSYLYTTLASTGALGYQASVRLNLQGDGSPLLMLLGGRHEGFLASPLLWQTRF